jgi:hypothetical protein
MEENEFEKETGCPFEAISPVIKEGTCWILTAEDVSEPGNHGVRVKPGIKLLEGIEGVGWDELNKAWTLEGPNIRCDRYGSLWFDSKEKAEKTLSRIADLYSSDFDDEVFGRIGGKSKGWLPYGLTLRRALICAHYEPKRRVFETASGAKEIKEKSVAFFPNVGPSGVFAVLTVRPSLSVAFFESLSDASDVGLSVGSLTSSVGLFLDHSARQAFEAALFMPDKTVRGPRPTDLPLPTKDDPFVVLTTDGDVGDAAKKLKEIEPLLEQ